MSELSKNMECTKDSFQASMPVTDLLTDLPCAYFTFPYNTPCQPSVTVKCSYVTVKEVTREFLKVESDKMKAGGDSTTDTRDLVSVFMQTIPIIFV